MLRRLTPEQQGTFLRALAASVEAQAAAEHGIEDGNASVLVAQAGVFSAGICADYPPEHPLTTYASEILTWAATTLLTPTCWRFGRALMQHAVGLTALNAVQRAALEERLRESNEYATPGDSLGSVDDVLSRPVRRLLANRSDDDPPDAASMVSFQYVVASDLPEGDRIQLAERALRDTHSLGIGSLSVRGSELIYDFGVNEDAHAPASVSALAQAAILAAKIGGWFRSQHEAAT